MPNAVVINVTANTGQAEKDFKRINERFKSSSKELTGLKQGFQGLTKSMALAGLGTLSFGVAMAGIRNIVINIAKEEAKLDFVFGLLPVTMKDAIARMQPRFKELQKTFNVTAEDVTLALAILMRDTRRSNITFEQLAGTLGFVARGEKDVEGAATLIASAMNGDIAAIKAVTGFWTSLDDALELSAATGDDAITIFDQLDRGFKDTALSAGRLIDDLLTGQWGSLTDDVKRLGDDGFGSLDDNIVGAAKNLADVLEPAISTFFGKVKTFFAGNNFKISDAEIESLRLYVDQLSRASRLPPATFALPGLPSLPDLTDFDFKPENVVVGGGQVVGHARVGDNPLIAERPRIHPILDPILGFAHGGIVRKPTLAMVGESGPEAIVPLGQGMGGTTINIFGNVDSEQTASSLARQVKEQISTDNRRGVTI